jgi:hypothetical protein
MKKLFDLKNNNWLIHLIAIGVLLLGAFVNFFPHSGIFFDDPFHYGEYVATLPSVLVGEMSFITIHGALDWMPAWIAQLFVGTERHFLITMALYAVLNLIACFLLYLIITLFAQAHIKYWAFILLVSSVTAIYLVSHKDVFLLLSIFLFFLHQRFLQSELQARLLEVSLGIALAVGMFWSFDRGVAGIGGIGGACMILFATERRHSITVISFILFIAIFSWMGFFSFTDHIDNFKFLLATSSQWSYGFQRFAVLMTLVAAIFNAMAAYYLVKGFFRSYGNDWRELANIYLIFVLCLIMLKIGINRADMGHIDMALWMPILAYLYLRIKQKERPNILFLVILTLMTSGLGLIAAWYGRQYLLGVSTIIPVLYIVENKFPKLSTKFTDSRWAVFIFAFVVISINGTFFTLNLIHERYQWLVQITNPPRNELLVDESIRWVSTEILKAGSNCVFDLSNHGVINGVSGLSACTRYTYPVYATQHYEADMIQQLQKRSPPVVVYSSTHVAFEIDGRSMHDRFPELKKYMLKTYQYEKCNFGYCLRYLHQPTEKSIAS